MKYFILYDADITDPVFEVQCPKTITKVAKTGETSWTGQIEPPTATDNAGQVTVRRSDFKFAYRYKRLS